VIYRDQAKPKIFAKSINTISGKNLRCNYVIKIELGINFHKD